MKLIQIARYPVKSLRGERLSVGEVEPDGLRGDRCWGIRDEATRKILTARRAPGLLFASASLSPDGAPVITLPSGVICQGPGPDTDAALSTWLGKRVSLVSSLVDAPASAEYFADATDDASEAIEWTMPTGRFVDAQPLLVLTTSSLRTAGALHPDGVWDLRRFRANLVIDTAGEGWLEDEWCGRAILAIGAVRMAPQEPCVRCTMVTRPQPGLGEDRDIFRTLARHHGGLFGVWTAVATPGLLTVGSEVSVERMTSDPFGAQIPLGQQRRGHDEPRPVDVG